MGQMLALLLVAVVIPSACVLWFMNEAATNQAAVAQRSVTEAYRGQLRLLRGRANAYWPSRASELDAHLTADAPENFKDLVARDAADSTILMAADGSTLYPSVASSGSKQVSGDPADSAAARAAQFSVRTLIQTGNKAAAVDAISRAFIVGAGSKGRDSEGRLIAADEQLLLISLLAPSDQRRPAAIDRLAVLLNDYTTTSLPSPQRVFLTAQLQTMAGVAGHVRFPTFEAERLALAFLDNGRPTPADGSLRPTNIRNVWQLTSSSGRVIALFRTPTIMRTLQAIVDERGSANVAFAIVPPGDATGDEAIPIGGAMPGWAMSFVVTDLAVGAQHASGRRNAYLAAALLAIGVIAIAAIFIGGTISRQARLAALKTDLVSTVSHELKTPVASMQLLVDSLLEDAELDASKTREYLELMATENARLSRLIENFLTFSRLDRNRYRFTFQPTNPSMVVDDTLRAMTDRRRADRAPHVEVAPNLPAIVADKDALITALLNLLDNAYKYTPANQSISVRVFREKRNVVFAVQDNGIGIPAAEQRRIFRWFYRVDQRLDRDTAGFGLGLSIVDAIARAHGGRVRVQSEPTRGSTFEMSVPCLDDRGTA